MVRKVIFELLLLGIAIGLTVEIFKTAIPYLPLMWLLVLAHYTWEVLSHERVLGNLALVKSAFHGKRTLMSYLVVGIFGSALFLFYWWGLNSFLGPKIKAYEIEQKPSLDHPNGASVAPKSAPVADKTTVASVDKPTAPARKPDESFAQHPAFTKGTIAKEFAKAQGEYTNTPNLRLYEILNMNLNELQRWIGSWEAADHNLAMLMNDAKQPVPAGGLTGEAKNKRLADLQQRRDNLYKTVVVPEDAKKIISVTSHLEDDVTHNRVYPSWNSAGWHSELIFAPMKKEKFTLSDLRQLFNYMKAVKKAFEDANDDIRPPS